MLMASMHRFTCIALYQNHLGNFRNTASKDALKIKYIDSMRMRTKHILNVP